MKTKILTIVITLMVFGIIVSFNNIYKPKTPVVKKEYNIKGFNKIYTFSSVDVFLTQGDEEKIVVETNEEYQKNVIIEKSGTKLNIKSKGKIINPDKFNVYITVKNLIDVRSAGSGDIKTENQLNFKQLNFKLIGSGDLKANLNSETVSVEIQGSGDALLSGKIKDLKVYSFGSGDIKIDEIHLKSLLISSKGSGDAILKGSSDVFNLDVNGSGDIKAKSFKTKETNINSGGSGDVIIYVEKTANVKIDGSGDVEILGNPENKKIVRKGDDIR